MSEHLSRLHEGLTAVDAARAQLNVLLRVAPADPHALHAVLAPVARDLVDCAMALNPTAAAERFVEIDAAAAASQKP